MKDQKDKKQDGMGELIDLRSLLAGVEESDESLDEIMAEFSDRTQAARRRAEEPDTRPVILRPRIWQQPEEDGLERDEPEGDEPEKKPPEQEMPPVEASRAPREPEPPRERLKRKAPRPSAEPKPSGPKERTAGAKEEGGKVIPLWEEPAHPLREKLSGLFHRANDFADDMFHEEDHPDKDAELAEKYIPGTDEEDVRPSRERRPRPEPKPEPDYSPAELVRMYTRGLNGLRLRMLFSCLLCLLMLGLTFWEKLGLPLPVLFTEGIWLTALLAWGLGVSFVLAIDLAADGLAGLVRGRSGPHTIAALAALTCLGDAVWVCLKGREGPTPYCALASVALFACLWGSYRRRRGLRLTCKTASLVAEPYLVTRDEAKWNGRGTFAKHKGAPVGFGSQVQSMDGAQRIYRVMTPLILIACVLFALLASVGRGAPDRLLWCLSVILTAASPLSGILAFGLPFDKIARRLSQSGAALAGWRGAAEMGGDSGVLITDTDLFPPGSVSLNGIKVFGDFSIEKVIGCTASLIKESGSGLDRTFHDLLRTQGAIYRRMEGFCCYEGGGLSASMRGEQVLVGSASFMALMEVPMPQGLKVKNAVFCAIDGELAGIFALNYTQPGNIRPSLAALIRSRVSPVLATRDFNIIPAMLRQRFKLPVEKMEFPPVERRMELSSPFQDYDPTICALLCREGLTPLSEAVVGGRRLKRVVRINAVLAVLASLVGALLGFYLTFVEAYGSLSPLNLFLFMLAWLVPVLLVSNLVDRY